MCPRGSLRLLTWANPDFPRLEGNHSNSDNMVSSLPQGIIPSCFFLFFL
ncbi:hypothetical protein COLO4_36830 [Corchorus olitorius]|uniref:Uncharacterized protein n=1 Tax=Corchorus olitorius TaxID=93759 RepID=A0A1R3G542_9ROSI|nr:hypothetical protein COLO4_36830 [Corchorus olitorius]